MTVKVRQWTKGTQMGVEVDIRFTYPDGTPFRQRVKAPVESKSAAKRWATQGGTHAARVRAALRRQPREGGSPQASTVDWIEKTFRNHLYPQLGDKRLDTIDDEDVRRLKARLSDCNRKTVNNVLGVLGFVEHGQVASSPPRAMISSCLPVMLASKLPLYASQRSASSKGSSSSLVWQKPWLRT
jgi:hypothetical protein